MMKKILTAKIQELKQELPQFAENFSNSIIIEPEKKEVLLKKGKLYILFSVKGSANFDTQLITKVVHDTVHDSYYQSDNISPIQSLEKAILSARDKVGQLSNDAISKDSQATEFNIATVVLWGNVLYVAKYGETQTYLMRGGSVNEMKTMSEGNFSTASGVVKDDDVVIMATEDFGNEFPPKVLLTTNMLEQDFKPSQACILMRIHIDTNFSEDEIVDFGLEKTTKKNLLSVAKEKLPKLPKKDTSTSSVSKKKPNGKKEKKEETKEKEEVKLPKPSRGKFKIEPKIKNASTGSAFNKKKLLLIVIPILFIVLGVSSIFIFKKDKTEAPVIQEQPIVERNPDSEEQVPNFVDNKEQDEELLVERVNPKVFYDVKITNSEANPSDIAAIGDYIVVADKITGKLYTSLSDTAKFEEQTTTFNDIKSMIHYEGKLHIVDSEGYKVFAAETGAVENSYTVANLDMGFPYADSLYAISGTKLTKYIPQDDGNLEESLWGQNEEFNGAKSIAIDFSIYIITKDGEVSNFSAGSKTDFETTVEFENPTKIIANIDFENIYILDTDNRSIVVIDDEGKLIKTYKNENPDNWDNLVGIDLSPDEESLFVLNGSTVYKISL